MNTLKSGPALVRYEERGPIIVPVPRRDSPRDRGRHYPEPIVAISRREAVGDRNSLGIAVEWPSLTSVAV